MRASVDLVAAARANAERGSPLAGPCAFTAGIRARETGIDRSANPFDRDGEDGLRAEWLDGWDGARWREENAAVARIRTRYSGPTYAAATHDHLEKETEE